MKGRREAMKRLGGPHEPCPECGRLYSHAANEKHHWIYRMIDGEIVDNEPDVPEAVCSRACAEKVMLRHSEPGNAYLHYEEIQIPRLA